MVGNDIIINNNRKHTINNESNTNLDIQTIKENNKIVKSKEGVDNSRDKKIKYIIVCRKYQEKGGL